VLRAGVVASSATSNGSGQYATGTLTSGLYAVRVSASGFVPEIRTSVGVGGGAVTSVNVALGTAGTITGQISASGAGPIAGAAVNDYGRCRRLLAGDQTGNVHRRSIGPGIHLECSDERCCRKRRQRDRERDARCQGADHD
jgi:hypothetical protein